MAFSVEPSAFCSASVNVTGDKYAVFSVVLKRGSLRDAGGGSRGGSSGGSRGGLGGGRLSIRGLKLESDQKNQREAECEMRALLQGDPPSVGRVVLVLAKTSPFDLGAGCGQWFVEQSGEMGFEMLDAGFEVGDSVAEGAFEILACDIDF